MKIKSISAVILVLVMLVCIISCGGNSNTATPTAENTSGTETSVSTGENEASDGLKAAKEYLYSLYKDNAESTGADYKVVSAVSIQGVNYDITWSVDVESGVEIGETKDGFVTIDVEDKSESEIAYTLTATISEESGASLTVNFKHKVPKYEESGWDAYIAACKAGTEESVTITGYVVGIVASPTSSSKGSMWIQDAQGRGYYAYCPTLDASITETRESINAEFPIGTQVTVTGTVTLYNGCYEYNKGCTVTKTGKTASDNGVALDYTDATADFAAASSNTDGEKLDIYQSAKVTLKNCTMLNVDGSYYYFTVGDSKVVYNVYKNNYLMEDTTALFENWKEGMKADISGIVSVYSKTFQIYPDALTSITLVKEDLTDAQKVDRVEGILSLEDTVASDVSIDLPTTQENFEGVSISWAVENNAAAKIDGGKLVVKIQSAEVTFKVTATIQCGDAKKTKEFSVTALAGEMSYAEIVEKAYALATGETLPGTFTLVGKVTLIDTVYSETYGNITVTIEVEGTTGKPIQCFRMKGNGIDKIAVGDTITVKGTLKNFNGTIEFDTGCEYVTSGSDDPTVITGTPVIVDAPVAGTKYKLSVFQNNADVNKKLYFSGALTDNGYYIATVEDPNTSPDVVAEETTGGYYLTFTVNGVKKYIVVTVSGTHTNASIADAPSTVWTFDSTIRTFVTDLSGTAYYLGCYNTFTTISASKTSYINAENVDVSQFPVRLVTFSNI